MKHVLLIICALPLIAIAQQKQGTLYIKGGEKIIVSKVKKVNN